MKKAIVFDNSGTLLKRYRVIKNLSNGKFCSSTNSLKIVEKNNDAALVVLQFNSMCLKTQDQNMKLYDFIKNNKIKFSISYSMTNISNEDVLAILKNSNAIIKDIMDGLNLLSEKLENIDACNGSAIILDTKHKKVDFTISSAGYFFPNTKKTIEILKSREIDIFIASGDRSATIRKLTEVLSLDKDNGFPTASTIRKQEIIEELQSKGYKVMMVGDGINDVLAFKSADISVLTLEQFEEVDKKLINTTDYMIHDILEVTEIDF
ncbi:HAD family hydrolase [Methanobrevibacter sp. DSM 116169]|uniref:HAD family hydrolase n=1 Tax=Methanobrevibacter sp. DSM 116169 TaxID=3242727 RepID=UPI0038FD38B4